MPGKTIIIKYIGEKKYIGVTEVSICTETITYKDVLKLMNEWVIGWMNERMDEWISKIFKMKNG